MPPAVDRAAVLRMLAGAACISSAGVFVTVVAAAPTASAFWRLALATLLLGLLRWRPGRWPRPDAFQFALLALAAACFAADLWMWHRSILYVGPGLATLLANLQVFVMALLGFALYRERVGPRFGIGLLLALAGLWLLLAPGWEAFAARQRTGVWLGLGTALAYGAYLIALRHVQKARRPLPVDAALWWTSLLCALMLGGVALAQGESLAIVDLRDLALLLAYAGIAQVGGWILIVGAMPRLSAALVGLLLLAQPVSAYLLDMLLFDARLAALGWLGMALSLAGIFVGSLRGAQRAPASRAP